MKEFYLGPVLWAFKRLPFSWLLACALFFEPFFLHAEPFRVNSGNTCLTCHSFTPASGSLAINFINGVTATSAPYGVTVVAGTSFTLQFRATGLYLAGSYPDTGGTIMPPNTTSWTVSTGPTWWDNGSYTGATPWIALNSHLYCTNYPASESAWGNAGTTTNNGQSTAPADKNGLASDEVMSATIGVSSSLAAGTYPVTVAEIGYTTAPVSWSQNVSVYVIKASPTVTPTLTSTRTVTLTVTPTISMTFSVSPTLAGTLTDSPTITQTFTTSPTYSVSPTFSATGTVTATPSSSPTATPTPTASRSWTVTPTFSISPTSTNSPVVTPTAPYTNSFTSVLESTLVPNPVFGNQAGIYFRLLSACDDVQARIYTRSMVLAQILDLGPGLPGGNLAKLALSGQLENQVYYVQLRARTGQQEVTSPTLKLMVLR